MRTGEEIYQDWKAQGYKFTSMTEWARTTGQSEQDTSKTFYSKTPYRCNDCGRSWQTHEETGQVIHIDLNQPRLERKSCGCK